MIVETEEFLSQAYARIYGSSLNYCVLSGPSFANEIVLGYPTLIVCASENQECS
jgi:glycerol-3-phosphate dehydrogenase